MDTRTADPLGTSLALIDGDLRITTGDLELVAGRGNLHQGLSNLISTPLGSDLFNVGYGFELSRVIELPRGLPGGLRLTKELIRLNLVRTLSVDDRVAEVREVIFDDSPRFFELVPGGSLAQAREQHTQRRTWRAVVVLTLASGQEDTLTLAGPRI